MMQAMIGAVFGVLAGALLYELGRRRDECISNAIEKSEERIMAKITDLKEELDGLGGVIGQVVVDVDTLTTLIVEMKGQQGHSEETEAKLSEMHEQVKGMRAKLSEVHDKGDDYNQPPAEPSPTARHR